jgi:hypothetical protein
LSYFAPILTIPALHAQRRVRPGHQAIGFDLLEAFGADPVFPLLNARESLVELLKLASYIAPESANQGRIVIVFIIELNLKPVSERDQHLFDVGRLWCARGTIRVAVSAAVLTPCANGHLYSSYLAISGALRMRIECAIAPSARMCPVPGGKCGGIQSVSMLLF